MDYKLKQIRSQQTLVLREKILRPGHKLSDLKFDRDDDDGAAHLGLFINDKHIGIATVYKESRDGFDSQDIWRLRGMAIDDTYQGQNFGEKLLMACIKHCEKEKAKELWCNARSHAVGFYEKYNFRCIGDEFEIAGVGPHYVMTREILT